MWNGNVWTLLVKSSGSRIFTLFVVNLFYSIDVGLYLEKIPLVIFGGLGFQAAKRVLSSLSDNSTFRVRLGMSMVMVSPFLRTAIGPPSKASGATCPMLPPRVAPEKRPSVIKATLSAKTHACDSCGWK